jgi:S1-C subfamily serine protease
LVNSHGQVIGMDTAAGSSYQFQTQSGQTAEQAYSIPINEAVSIAQQIEAGHGSPTIHIGATAFLGLELGSSSTGSGDGFGGFGGQGASGGQTGTTGVALAGTLSGSPAANAGLTDGDTVTALAGQSVSSASDIQQILVKYHPGDSISITWVGQSGQSQTSNLTLTTGPAA